jgi:gas vesicle protein
MDSGKTILGVLAGIAIGATLGILFAPDSGATTRKKISRKGRDYVQGLNDQFDDLIDDMNEQFESLKAEAKAKVTQMAHEGKVKAEAFKSDVTHAAQAKMNEVRADARSAVS